MTDETIQTILERLNRGRPEDIIIRPVAPRVCWGFVWGPTVNGYTSGGVQQEGDEFFFVSDESGKFVAAVLRMGRRDLHWYVTKKCRGKGILREPLRKIILPFIFKTYPWCETQRGTVEPERSYGPQSARLAMNVGFRKVKEAGGKHFYEISRTDVPPYVGAPPAPVDKERLQRLKRDVQICHREVEMLRHVLMVKYAERFKHEKLDEVRSHVADAYLGLEDIIEDVKYSGAEPDAT